MRITEGFHGLGVARLHAPKVSGVYALSRGRLTY